MTLNKRGFTLIELLVVIAIIGLLSVIVVVQVQKARVYFRDTKRMHDLNQVRLAFVMYYDDEGNWMEEGSDCGSGDNGIGWFNYQGGSYTRSISGCLKDKGITPIEFLDPTEGKTSTPTEGFTYMKYHCDDPVRVYLLAKLEGKPQDTTATDNTCCPTCDSNYGMNYFIRVE